MNSLAPAPLYSTGSLGSPGEYGQNPNPGFGPTPSIYSQQSSLVSQQPSYGAPPPPAPQNPYGQTPPPQPAAPSGQPPQGYNSGPPAQQNQNPYGGGPPQNPYGAPPPTHPYGGGQQQQGQQPPQNPHGQPPWQQPQQPAYHGGPMNPPNSQGPQNPYQQGVPQNLPYGAPQNVGGQQPQPNQPHPNPNPYGQPPQQQQQVVPPQSQNPYGGQQANPYGQAMGTNPYSSGQPAASSQGAPPPAQQGQPQQPQSLVPPSLYTGGTQTVSQTQECAAAASVAPPQAPPATQPAPAQTQPPTHVPPNSGLPAPSTAAPAPVPVALFGPVVPPGDGTKPQQEQQTALVIVLPQTTPQTIAGAVQQHFQGTSGAPQHQLTYGSTDPHQLRPVQQPEQPLSTTVPQTTPADFLLALAAASAAGAAAQNQDQINCVSDQLRSNLVNLLGNPTGTSLVNPPAPPPPPAPASPAPAAAPTPSPLANADPASGPQALLQLLVNQAKKEILQDLAGGSVDNMGHTEHRLREVREQVEVSAAREGGSRGGTRPAPAVPAENEALGIVLPISGGRSQHHLVQNHWRGSEPESQSGVGGKGAPSVVGGLSASQQKQSPEEALRRTAARGPAKMTKHMRDHGPPATISDGRGLRPPFPYGHCGQNPIAGRYVGSKGNQASTSYYEDVQLQSRKFLHTGKKPMKGKGKGKGGCGGSYRYEHHAIKKPQNVDYRESSEWKAPEASRTKSPSKQEVEQALQRATANREPAKRFFDPTTLPTSLENSSAGGKTTKSKRTRTRPGKGLGRWEPRVPVAWKHREPSITVAAKDVQHFANRQPDPVFFDQPPPLPPVSGLGQHGEAVGIEDCTAPGPGSTSCTSSSATGTDGANSILDVANAILSVSSSTKLLDGPTGAAAEDVKEKESWRWADVVSEVGEQVGGELDEKWSTGAPSTSDGASSNSNSASEVEVEQAGGKKGEATQEAERGHSHPGLVFIGRCPGEDSMQIPAKMNPVQLASAPPGPERGQEEEHPIEVPI